MSLYRGSKTNSGQETAGNPVVQTKTGTVPSSTSQRTIDPLQTVSSKCEFSRDVYSSGNVVFNAVMRNSVTSFSLVHRY